MDDLLYHVTAKEHLAAIKASGLQPTIGQRSSAASEQIPSVYLFTSWEACEDGLMNWLGDELEDAYELVILEVDATALQLTQITGYEVICTDTIEPSRIVRILDETGQPMSQAPGLRL